MDIAQALKIVFDRKSVLEDELADGPSHYEKRLILMNLNACAEMICYLQMIERGMQPRFKIQLEHAPVLKKTILA
jgi:hypothetical protein